MRHGRILRVTHLDGFDQSAWRQFIVNSVGRYCVTVNFHPQLEKSFCASYSLEITDYKLVPNRCEQCVYAFQINGSCHCNLFSMCASLLIHQCLDVSIDSLNSNLHPLLRASIAILCCNRCLLFSDGKFFAELAPFAYNILSLYNLPLFGRHQLHAM